MSAPRRHDAGEPGRALDLCRGNHFLRAEDVVFREQEQQWSPNRRQFALERDTGKKRNEEIFVR